MEAPIDLIENNLTNEAVVASSEACLTIPKNGEDHVSKAATIVTTANEVDINQGENKELDERIADESTTTADNVNEEEDNETDERIAEAKKRKQPEKPPEWFDIADERNTQVYVSNLPLDTTEEEFITLMKKYGYLMKDVDTNEFKIKMYKDKQGNFKGDALAGYLKRESVDLAIQLLDESIVKNNVIHVERAKFTLKGEYDPSKKPKRSKRSKEKMKKAADRLLAWGNEKMPGERPKCDRIVIIKNMFDIKEFAADPKIILEYRNDVRDECTERCGEVKKVEIYDNNPEGVASVIFADFDAAAKCVKLMNGRFFAGRQLISHLWDGKTKYKIQETEEQIEKRMKEWSDYLEKDENN